jgi:hypothetical protein
MYLCVLSHDGELVFHENLVAAPQPFLEAIAPFREGLVVGAECIFNDRVDSQKIAALLRGGTFLMAYVYPREMRSTRNLLRRRTYLVRRRADLLAHIQNTNSQPGSRDSLRDPVHRPLRQSPGLLLLRESREEYKKRLEKKHGKAKALSILAHRLGRAVFYMRLGRHSALICPPLVG